MKSKSVPGGSSLAVKIALSVLGAVLILTCIDLLVTLPAPPNGTVEKGAAAPAIGAQGEKFDERTVQGDTSDALEALLIKIENGVADALGRAGK